MPGPQQRKPGHGLGASWPAARKARELGLAEPDGGCEPPTAMAAALGRGVRRRTVAVIAAAVIAPPVADARRDGLQQRRRGHPDAVLAGP